MSEKRNYSELQKRIKKIPLIIGYVFKNGKKYLATYNHPKSEKHHRIIYNLYDIKKQKLVGTSRIEDLTIPSQT